jgi:hypothetical protein
MNTTKILISTLLAATVVSGVVVMNYTSKNTAVGSYEPMSLSINEGGKGKNWNDAKEYLDMIYANVNTGEVDPNDYYLAKQQILNTAWPKAVNMTFTEEGPNNIGGRTRAIAAHPTDPNIIYAGSVSGGLFKSVNAGNSWTKLQAWDDAVPTNCISSCVKSPSGPIMNIQCERSLLAHKALNSEQRCPARQGIKRAFSEETTEERKSEKSTDSWICASQSPRDCFKADKATR